MATWIKRALAFLVAWTIVYAAFTALDKPEGWVVTPYAIAWICVGIGLRLQKTGYLASFLSRPCNVGNALCILLRWSLWPFELRR